MDALKQTLNKFNACPTSVKELGKAWLPFARREDISEIWHAFVDESQCSSIYVEFNNNLSIILNLNLA